MLILMKNGYFDDLISSVDNRWFLIVGIMDIWGSIMLC